MRKIFLILFLVLFITAIKTELVYSEACNVQDFKALEEQNVDLQEQVQALTLENEELEALKSDYKALYINYIDLKNRAAIDKIKIDQLTDFREHCKATVAKKNKLKKQLKACLKQQER